MLDDLTTQLLECGGVLSQIVSHMVASQASGLSAPETAPIPEVAHSLIRGVIEAQAPRRHAEDELALVAAVLRELTEAISENVFLVPLPNRKERRAARRTGGH